VENEYIIIGGTVMFQVKVLSVKPLPDYRILVKYETGEEIVFDVKPYINGEWFGQLKDPEVFATVHPRGSTVEWAGGQDIPPDELYQETFDRQQTQAMPDSDRSDIVRGILDLWLEN